MDAEGQAGGLDRAAEDFRSLRRVLEKDVLPLATSVDGRRFSFQASLHGLELEPGSYVVLENGGEGRLGQVVTVELARSAGPDVVPDAGAETSSLRMQVVVRHAVGVGRLLDGPHAPFHDATVRPARAEGPTRTTLREAGEAWLEGAEKGTIRTRSGHVYKPSVIRSYRQGLRDHVLPELGAVKLHEIQRRDLQDLADGLLAKGLDASTVRNAMAPVRCIYRRAVARGVLAVNPTSGLELAAPQGRRERRAAPTEATALIDALPAQDRALWAVAFYGGSARARSRD